MATVSITCAGVLINPANFFAVGIYDASSNTLLETVAPVKGGGYTNPFQITFLNSYAIGKVYRVIWWENTSGVVGGTSRCSGSLTPSVFSPTFRADKFYTYGTSAEMTTNTTIVDPTLIGWGIGFELFGSGTLQPTVDYTFDPTTGTIVLINGMNYQNGQKVIVHFLPQVTAAPTSSGGITTGRVIASAADTLSSADKNSALFLQGSGGSFVAALPPLASMSDFDVLEFYSYGGNHIYATLQCAGTDKIQWNALRTKLFMRQGTNLVLFKANGVWNVKGDTMPMCSIGETIYKWSNTEFPYIFADGSLLDRVMYAGLFDYFSALPSAALVADAVWANTTTLDGITYFPNKGKWTAGNGSTTFRAPLLINQFLRGADGSTRLPGSFQADAMQKHTHPNNKGGTTGNYPFGKGPVRVVGGDTGGFNTNDELTDAPFNYPGANVLGTILSKVDTETRPENISLYALIRL